MKDLKTHHLSARVYYKDTDAGGVVYYSRYAEFMEMGRTELLRELGLSAHRLAEEFGILCPVVELKINYRRSAKYDDLLTIATTISEVTAVRIYFKQTISNQKNELLAEGMTINCSVAEKTLKPTKFPKALQELFI